MVASRRASASPTRASFFTCAVRDIPRAFRYLCNKQQRSTSSDRWQIRDSLTSLGGGAENVGRQNAGHKQWRTWNSYIFYSIIIIFIIIVLYYPPLPQRNTPMTHKIIVSHHKTTWHKSIMSSVRIGYNEENDRQLQNGVWVYKWQNVQIFD